MKVEIKKDYAESGKRPYSIYIDNVLLRKKDGTGRRFATEKAAKKVADAVCQKTLHLNSCKSN